MAMQALDSIEPDSPAVLLYFYLWPFWMFKDVGKGNLLEQAAAYQYNRAQRMYLPAYIIKWSVLFLTLLGFVYVVEGLGDLGVMLPLAASLISALFGLAASGALVVVTQVCVVYLFLCRWRY